MATNTLRSTKLRMRRRDLIRATGLVLSALGTSVAAGVAGSFVGSDLSLGDIQGWSFSLGQVSFGLAAAFLALIIAQLGDFRRWWDQWRDRLPEKLPDVTDPCLDALEKFSSHAASGGWLDGHDVDFINRQLQTSQSYQPSNRMEYVLPVLQRLQHLFAREMTWKRLVHRAGVSSDLSEDFRAIALAETFTRDLSRLYTKLMVNTVSLCAITLILGILSLSPDPFYYGTILSKFFHIDPDYAETNYKMFALVSPAAVMMGWMTFLGYRVGIIFAEINRIKPDQFDNGLWQFLSPYP